MFFYSYPNYLNSLNKKNGLATCCQTVFLFMLYKLKIPKFKVQTFCPSTELLFQIRIFHLFLYGVRPMLHFHRGPKTLF